MRQRTHQPQFVWLISILLNFVFFVVNILFFVLFVLKSLPSCTSW
jgi:hypothetical protein